MREYKHLQLEERNKIYVLKQAGNGVTAIAKELGRDKSVVSRELSRNATELGYLPDTADKKYQERRLGRTNKILATPELRDYIVAKMHENWSPEQVAGRMKEEKKPFYVCHETIYQFVYSTNGKAFSLWNLLLYKQSRRGQIYGRKHRSDVIKDRVSIHERPQEINQRSSIGHFEGDLTFFHGSRSENLTVLTERSSRLTLLIKNHSKRSEEVTSGIIAKITPL